MLTDDEILAQKGEIAGLLDPDLLGIARGDTPDAKIADLRKRFPAQFRDVRGLGCEDYKAAQCDLLGLNTGLAAKRARERMQAFVETLPADGVRSMSREEYRSAHHGG